MKDPDENLLFLSFDEEYIMEEVEKSFYVETPDGQQLDAKSNRELESKLTAETGVSLVQRVKSSPVKFVGPSIRNQGVTFHSFKGNRG